MYFWYYLFDSYLVCVYSAPHILKIVQSNEQVVRTTILHLHTPGGCTHYIINSGNERISSQIEEAIISVVLLAQGILGFVSDASNHHISDLTGVFFMVKAAAEFEC